MLALFLALFLGWGFPVRATNKLFERADYSSGIFQRSTGKINELFLREYFATVRNKRIALIAFNKAEQLPAQTGIGQTSLWIMDSHVNHDASARARNQAQTVLVPEKSANNKKRTR
jgi:hypothetical protein